MSDSDVDRILREVLGHAQKKPAAYKFDKDAFLKALNESLVERVPRLISVGHAGLFVYRGNVPLEQIARGMAAAIRRPAVVIRLQSEDLQRGEGWQLLRPLLHGETLVLVHEESSSIGENLAAYWPKFVRNPKGYAAPVAKGLMLDHRLSIESPGSVVVLQRESTRLSNHEITEWPLVEEDALELTALAASWPGDVVTIGRPPSARIMIRDNEEAYRVYRQLVKDIEAAGYDRTVAERIGASAIKGADRLKLELAFHVDQVDLQLYETLYYRLTALSEHCGKIHGGFREDEALPDVYAAAIIISKLWNADPKHEVVYRGQRNSAWPLVPSYFRPGKDGTPLDLDTREKRLRRFAGLLARDYPELSEWQCVAVAQHVSSEAKTPTWLIDVTSDPLIALYFASTDGQTGDLGIVDQVVMPEWRAHVAGAEDIPGGFMAIEVPVIERVTRQRGLFLNAPRADLYERYAPHRLWFRQQSGVRFTDSTADPPIDDAWLLPPEAHLDELIAAVDDAKVQVQVASIVAPPADPRASLTAKRLLDTVMHREDVAALDSFHRFVLDVIAELFANPQEWTDQKDSSKFSVHRFDEAIRWLSKAQEGIVSRNRRACVEDALKFTKTRLTSDEWSALIGRAHQIWMERYRIPPEHVVTEIIRIVDEVSGFAPTVVGATFAGPPEHREVVLHALAAEERWRFYDLRSALPEEVLAHMPELSSAGVAVVAANRDLEPYPLRMLAKAIQDRQSFLQLETGHFAIAEGCMIVFVFGEGKLFYDLCAPPMIPYGVDVDAFRSSGTFGSEVDNW